MIIVKTDASVKGDGAAGIGWEIEVTGVCSGYLQHGTITGHEILNGSYTSMQAEFLALVRGLKEAVRLGERGAIKLCTDCQPIVKKINNHIPIIDGKYIKTFHNLMDRIDHCDVKWVSREKNQTADREAHIALEKSLQQT